VTDRRRDGATGNGISLTRVFDAPRERVWKEWTEPEAFADWFGGAESDVPLATVSMDVRPGGSWRLTMFFGPERREIQWRGEYREVVEPERLVFSERAAIDCAQKIIQQTLARRGVVENITDQRCFRRLFDKIPQTL